MLTGETEALAVWWARTILLCLAAPSLAWGLILYLGKNRPRDDWPVGKRFVAFGVLCVVALVVLWLV